MKPGPLFFHRDCLHYRSDRPCAPHKAEGVTCEGCKHYAPVRGPRSEYGYIGLQNHDGRTNMYFKEVSVLE